MKTTLALLILLTTTCHAAESRVTWITNQYEVKYDVATNFAGYIRNTNWYWTSYTSNRLTLPTTISSITTTNVVEGSNQRGCPTCEMLRKAAESGGGILAIYHPWHNAEPWQEATEKWTITSVVERTTIVVEWESKPLTNTVEKILSSTTNRWKLAQEWRKE